MFVNEAVLAEQAFCFMYAVAGSLFSDGLRRSSFMIVWINNYFHISHVVIAYLYGISVKYFVKLVVPWKMLI